MTVSRFTLHAHDEPKSLGPALNAKNSNPSLNLKATTCLTGILEPNNADLRKHSLPKPETPKMWRKDHIMKVQLRGPDAVPSLRMSCYANFNILLYPRRSYVGFEPPSPTGRQESVDSEAPAASPSAGRERALETTCGTCASRLSRLAPNTPN